MRELDLIRTKVNEVLLPLNIHSKVSDLGCSILIEPSTVNVPNGERICFFDGMQIIYDKELKEYEVSECMAGANEDELHIYKVTKGLKIALKHLLKGNKRKPIEIIN